jgi:hypothetical protein
MLPVPVAPVSETWTKGAAMLSPDVVERTLKVATPYCAVPKLAELETGVRLEKLPGALAPCAYWNAMVKPVRPPSDW